MHQRVDNLVEFNGADLELFFATDILKLKSLHYGYWDVEPRTDELTLEALRAAQARFTERLLSFVPEGVRTVLDVGAGTGDNALALAKRGCRVTAISPDAHHGRFFEPLREHGIAYARSTFEDFASAERFDLVFMSESLNYFRWAVGLEQTRRHLRPGGHFLAAAMFRPDASEYVRLAADHGFRLEESVDITANVAPTIEMAHVALQEYAEPTLQLVGQFLQGSAPVKAWVLRKLFARQISDLQRIRDYYLERTDPARFRTGVRYMILRFST